MVHERARIRMCLPWRCKSCIVHTVFGDIVYKSTPTLPQFRIHQ